MAIWPAASSPVRTSRSIWRRCGSASARRTASASDAPSVLPDAEARAGVTSLGSHTLRGILTSCVATLPIFPTLDVSVRSPGAALARLDELNQARQEVIPTVDT